MLLLAAGSFALTTAISSLSLRNKKAPPFIYNKKMAINKKSLWKCKKAFTQRRQNKPRFHSDLSLKKPFNAGFAGIYTQQQKMPPSIYRLTAALRTENVYRHTKPILSEPLLQCYSDCYIFFIITYFIIITYNERSLAFTYILI